MDKMAALVESIHEESHTDILRAIQRAVRADGSETGQRICEALVHHPLADHLVKAQGWLFFAHFDDDHAEENLLLASAHIRHAERLLPHKAEMVKRWQEAIQQARTSLKEYNDAAADGDDDVDVESLGAVESTSSFTDGNVLPPDDVPSADLLPKRQPPTSAPREASAGEMTRQALSGVPPDKRMATALQNSEDGNGTAGTLRNVKEAKSKMELSMRFKQAAAEITTMALKDATMAERVL